MPFLGGLRNQAVEIVSGLHHYAGTTGLFCDPFFGGGSISHEAKRRGFQVASNDLAKRSFIPARALIVNGDTIPASTAARLVLPHADEEDFRGHKIETVIDEDILLFGRRLWHNAETDTERYLAMRVFMDLVPMGGFGLIKKTDTSNAAQEARARATKLLDSPSALIDRSRKSVNAGIMASPLEHKATQRDAIEHIAECGAAGAVIAHLDPPTYGTKQYDNHYWWLDWFIGDVVEETGRGFNKNEAIEFSRKCVQAAADIPVVCITQQEVAYDKKIAFDLLEEVGRQTEGFLIKSNTANPFFMVVGLK
jgi:hypothetical protein